jgi:hypothetical protein
MGKRELLIIIAFVVVGAAVYSLTAPPAKPGERGFSISKVFSGIKKEISANAASAHVMAAGRIAAPSTLTELRVSTARSVPLTIVGEAREDIEYEMPVESTGPDEATAKEWAGKVELRKDQLGSALELKTYFPDEGNQNAALTLRVPARLAVRVENSGQIKVSDVAGVELRNPTGEVTLSHVGTVSGIHRNGDLTIDGATAVNVNLVSSRTKIRNASESVSINARSGECTIVESTGPIAATVTNVELVVNLFKNSFTVTGDGGRLKVVNAAGKLSIDVRRMLVEIEDSQSPNADFTIITSDEPIRVTLKDASDIAIDAIASAGTVRADDFGLKPAAESRISKLVTAPGNARGHIVLRNSRADIVIVKRK